MSTQPIFLPKSLTCLRGYTGRLFLQDLTAGATVGVVALPLALAFGIASIPETVAADAGLSPPAMGLFTAVIAGLLISALGGSRVAIGGPTGAFIGIVYLIAAQHGYDGLAVATLMAGGFLVVMGLARLGGMIKYIPYPVTIGFTSGIGVVILVGQIKDLLGLNIGALPPGFIDRVRLYAERAASVNWQAAAVGVGSIVLIVVWRRWVSKKIPATIIAMALATAVVHLLGLGVETIGDRFGAIPTSLPAPRLPAFDLARAPELIGPAFTIAMLAAIESLLCCVVADGMLGTRHRSNTELIAQGIANLTTPIFGGIPATGAIARTATSVQSGARTPIAGVAHALTLLAIILAFGRFATLVPLASLAGVLCVVAWNMSEIHRVRWLLNGPRSDAAVLLTTFLLTVLVDLTAAVEVGLVLAAMLFIKRMADVTNVGAIRAGLEDSAADAPVAAGVRPNLRLPPGVELYEIDGPFFFGAAYKLRETLDAVRKPPRALILDVERVSALDATGLHALDELRRHAVRERVHVILVGVHAQPMIAMSRSGLTDAFGPDAFAGTVAEALLLANDRLERPEPPSESPTSTPPAVAAAR